MATKKKTGAPGQAAASPERTVTPAELLPMLDGWMANNGLNQDHPWRFAISKTLADAAAPAASAGDVTAKPVPLFEPFEWIAPDYQESLPSIHATGLASRARDVADGVAVLVEMFERDDIDGDFFDENDKPLRPVLGKVHRAELMRLAVASLRMLATESAALIDHVDDVRRRAAPAAAGKP